MSDELKLRPKPKIKYVCDELCLRRENWHKDVCTHQHDCDISFRAYIDWTPEEYEDALMEELERIRKLKKKEKK